MTLGIAILSLLSSFARAEWRIDAETGVVYNSNLSNSDLFGAPVASADDADRALRAALEMTTALDELNEQWQREGLPTVGVGIDINTGVVVAGNMGSETRLNYTRDR